MASVRQVLEQNYTVSQNDHATLHKIDLNDVVDSAEGMSQEFNKFFGSVFTKETSGEVPEADWMYKEVCVILRLLRR